jgi:1,4-dihydroxy-2-naphthoate octaprenyltransferase
LVVRRKFFSGKKILVDNPSLLPLARLTSLSCLITSISLSVIAVVYSVAPIELLIITMGANFLGWFYSAPPLRLVSRGLGEVAIALAAGFAIPAVGYLATSGQLEGLFGFFVVPFLLYGFMLALSLEAPDIENDSKGNKKNIGVRRGKLTIFGLVLGACLIAFGLFVVYSLMIQGLVVNFWVVTASAGVPLVAGILGFVGTLKKENANIFGVINVLALFIFNFLMIIYLASITLGY